jgi:alkanesulfonate monooxygenase SsuD/methylene tetrahydromethanopterin reductase-like flavin-dependent oxidoreductase (luciferase family)
MHLPRAMRWPTPATAVSSRGRDRHAKQKETDVKLGLTAGYWSSGPPAGIEASIAEAERLGFDSMWTAEAYGSDAITPLAWWGAKTTRIKFGTAIAQLSARTPTAMAMAALTLDHLSGGRFILGIGASGPQVVEGWYGQPYPRPLERTRGCVGSSAACWRATNQSSSPAATTRCRIPAA